MHTPPHMNVSSLRYRGVRLDRVRFTPLGKFVCGLGQSGGIIFGFVLLWGNEEFRCHLGSANGKLGVSSWSGYLGVNWCVY